MISDEFGSTKAGERVKRFTIDNGALQLQAMTYGATITSIMAPDRAGQAGDVVLGFDTLAEYEQGSAYFGAVIGRYANRLARARFELDGVIYHLPANEGPHHLHGGHRGFDKHVWDAHVIDDTDGAGVAFSRVSMDGEEGYPGNLTVRVTYIVNRNNCVALDYCATTDAATVLNPTQHTYFNLSAGLSPDVCDHQLKLRASRFTPVDADLIPTGALTTVEATPFDFRTPQRIGARIDESDFQIRYCSGYDHNWVLDAVHDDDAAAAFVLEPVSGRTLSVHTTEPAIQFYSGNRLSTMCGKKRRTYGPRAGLCLETQHFPNSPANPRFPSTVLRAGQTFRSRTTWTLSTQ